MPKKGYSSLTVTDEVKEIVKKCAAENNRSINGEIRERFKI